MTMNNQERAIDYIKAVFNDHDMKRAASYWGADLIQHNPMLPSGVTALRDALSGDSNANTTWDESISFENDDIVAVHGRYNNFFGKDMVTVDFFRFADGKIIEHWDVMQEEVPASKTASGNAMFPIEK